MGFFGKLFLGFLIVVAVLALVGFFLKKRETAKTAGQKEDDVLSQKTVENVNDLNDQFNRARYMDEDGK